MAGSRRKTTSARSHSEKRGRAVSVRVQAFGALTVDIDGNRLGRSADIVVSLLLFLVHSPGMQLPREDIMHMLWPSSPEQRQRGNLRQALYKLRLMGVDVEMSGDLVILDGQQIEPTFSVRRDAASFQAQVVQGHEPFGPFLLGFDTSASHALEDWVEKERERAHGDARRVLAQALRARHAVADWVAAEPLARWLLQFDPLNEAATLVMAECLLLAGAKYEAIRLLDRYMSELGPGAEDLRIPATTLRRRISAPVPRRISFAPSERHFMGRESVMADLTLCMRRARCRDGTATLLHGPAGMGKTRVLNELTKVGVIEGIRDVRASCRESDVTRPLSVFLDVVPDLMQMPGALGTSPESLQALRRFTNDDAGQSPAERVTPGVMQMPLAAGLRRAVVELIVAVSEEKPMLLTIEDVHWLDSASWEVMVDLISRIGQCRVCLIMTSRQPHARPTLPERVPPELTIKPLLPLSGESCLELAQAIGTDLSAHIDEDLGEWFVHTSEGVPLFLRSLVNHWIETGNAGGIPPTLLGVIGQRLQSLSSDALYVLQTVALLGRHANLSLTEAVLEMPYFRIVAAIDDLHKAGAFDSDTDGILVCHELIGRMAVDTLGRNARRALHKRIADMMLQSEAKTGISPATCRDRLGHLLHAGEQRVFINASVEAIRGLIDAGYAHEALAISDSTLLHAGGEAEQRSVIMTLQAEALYYCGEYARLLKHPLSPATVGQGLTNWETEAPAQLLRWIDSVSLADKGSDSIELVSIAVQVASSEKHTSLIRYSAATLAIRIASNTCDPESAAQAHRAGIAALQGVEGMHAKRDELDMLFHTSFGDPEIGGQAAERLLHGLERISSATERFSLSIRVAFALRHCGREAKALALLEKIHAESLAENLSAAYSNSSYRLSILHLDLGNIAASELWLREFERLAPLGKEPLAESLYHLQSVRLALHKGDVNRARFHFAKSHDAMPQRGHLFRYAYSLAARLAISRLAGDREGQVQMLEEAQIHYERTKITLGQAFLASEIALALHSGGRIPDARATINDYINIYRREPGAVPKCIWEAQVVIGGFAD